MDDQDQESKRIQLQHPKESPASSESITMSLHPHPNNILEFRSLQSILSSRFPEGLPEPCIAVILKETLKGLCHLHDQGHLHTDINAGNVLIDTDNGASIKLANCRKSVLNYHSRKSVTSSSSKMKFGETPYWMAPELTLEKDIGHTFGSDIWSFGITALELAYGRPPLDRIPKSLIVKIKERFSFSDYDDDMHKKLFKNKNFSKEFTEMVSSCLNQDLSKRPSVHRLLECSFFNNCEGGLELFKNIFDGLSDVKESFQEASDLHDSSNQITAYTDIKEIDDTVDPRTMCSWKFNVNAFVLEPVFHKGNKGGSRGGRSNTEVKIEGEHPPEIWASIFSKVDWGSLNNCRNQLSATMRKTCIQFGNSIMNGVLSEFSKNLVTTKKIEVEGDTGMNYYSNRRGNEVTLDIEKFYLDSIRRGSAVGTSEGKICLFDSSANQFGIMNPNFEGGDPLIIKGPAEAWRNLKDLAFAFGHVDGGKNFVIMMMEGIQGKLYRSINDRWVTSPFTALAVKDGPGLVHERNVYFLSKGGYSVPKLKMQFQN